MDNILVYEGERPAGETVFNFNVESYKKVFAYLVETGAYQSVMEAFRSLGRDHKTGLTNKLGFELSMDKLNEKGTSEGYFILLDGDGLHYHNKEKGYTAVDKLLEATGKAIMESTRSQFDRRSGERADSGRRYDNDFLDIVGHRVYGGGGDEFLVYVPLRHSEESKGIVQNIAQRALKNIYSRQREVAGQIHVPQVQAQTQLNTSQG